MKKDTGTHRIRKGILAVFMNLILIIFSLSCIFPMIWMLYSSLKEKRAFNADIVGLPKNPTLINYIRILSNSDYHLGESMFNSVRTVSYTHLDVYKRQGRSVPMQLHSLRILKLHS